MFNLQASTITELVVGALYCIVGLALLSMCFELMKEEFVAKVRWVGQFLHVVTDRHSDEDEDDIGDQLSLYGGGGGSGEMYYNEGEASGSKCRRRSRCHSQSFIVTSPQQRKSICVLRQHTGHCSMRKCDGKSSVRRKSILKPKEDGEGDTESMGVASEDFGEENGAFDGADFVASMDMAEPEKKDE